MRRKEMIHNIWAKLKGDKYDKIFVGSSVLAITCIIMAGIMLTYVTIEIELSATGELEAGAANHNVTINELSGKLKIQVPTFIIISIMANIGSDVKYLIPNLPPEYLEVKP